VPPPARVEQQLIMTGERSHVGGRFNFCRSLDGQVRRSDRDAGFGEFAGTNVKSAAAGDSVARIIPAARLQAKLPQIKAGVDQR